MHPTLALQVMLFCLLITSGLSLYYQYQTAMLKKRLATLVKSLEAYRAVLPDKPLTKGTIVESIAMARRIRSLYRMLLSQQTESGTEIRDLITDLLHLANLDRLDIDTEIRAAVTNFNDERQRTFAFKKK